METFALQYPARHGCATKLSTQPCCSGGKQTKHPSAMVITGLILFASTHGMQILQTPNKHKLLVQKYGTFSLVTELSLTHWPSAERRKGFESWSTFMNSMNMLQNKLKEKSLPLYSWYKLKLMFPLLVDLSFNHYCPISLILHMELPVRILQGHSLALNVYKLQGDDWQSCPLIH